MLYDRELVPGEISEEVPADGEWHRLMQSPVQSIVCGSLIASIDIDEKGYGHVRWPDMGRGAKREVRYTLAKAA